MRLNFLGMTLISAFLIGATSTTVAAGNRDHTWTVLAEGLEHGTFLGPASRLGDSKIEILRIDPEFWDFKLLAISEIGIPNTLTPSRWCEEYDLAAVINAGMFDVDYSTHVGFMSGGHHVNNPTVNHYKSVVTFDPRVDGLPRYRIHDLDAPGVDIENLRAGFGCLVQNLRMIKRPGINRWSQQEKSWSETALGEDGAGRALFIFCRTPYTMHDLNDILVSLPIDLVCAQHLEGGGLAQMGFRTADQQRVFVGSYETGGSEHDDNHQEWPLPNVIGVTRKGP